MNELLPAGYRLSPLTADRVGEALAAEHLTYALTEPVTPYLPPLDRSTMVEAPDGSLAALHASYPFRLPVPGGEVPAAGLTWVGVNQGHRRRGLLQAMVTTHLENTAERGEPVSVLQATEESIYGRFGYGRAADKLHATLPRQARLRYAGGGGDLEVTFTTAGPDDADLVDTLHRAAGRGRPGWLTRDLAALRSWVLTSAPWLGPKPEPTRLVVVRTLGGDPRGYALLRRTPTWQPEGPRYSVIVQEAVALDLTAYHRLWTFLLDLDLTATVQTPALAVDDPLLTWLVDRRASVPQLSDNLWLRLVDVGAALAARRYAAPADVVLDVRDELLPANTGHWWLRSAGPAVEAKVARTDGSADLVLDVRELGAVFLGGQRLAALVAAGLVTELNPGAAARADAAFGWPTAPLCSWEF